MTDLTDTEIVAACARAMGLERDSPTSLYFGKGGRLWTPLTDRAQAMELVEKFPLQCAEAIWEEASRWSEETRHNAELLRAICLCAARVQIEKEKNANG